MLFLNVGGCGSCFALNGAIAGAGASAGQPSQLGFEVAGALSPFFVTSTREVSGTSIVVFVPSLCVIVMMITPSSTNAAGPPAASSHRDNGRRGGEPWPARGVATAWICEAARAAGGDALSVSDVSERFGDDGRTTGPVGATAVAEGAGRASTQGANAVASSSAEANRSDGTFAINLR